MSETLLSGIRRRLAGIANIERAEDADPRTWMAGAVFIAHEAVKLVDTLDHEATTDEWRCPGFCDGMYECRCNTPFRVPGPCLCCQRDTQHVLVVPVREAA